MICDTFYYLIILNIIKVFTYLAVLYVLRNPDVLAQIICDGLKKDFIPDLHKNDYSAAVE